MGWSWRRGKGFGGNCRIVEVGVGLYRGLVYAYEVVAMGMECRFGWVYVEVGMGDGKGLLGWCGKGCGRVAYFLAQG